MEIRSKFEFEGRFYPVIITKRKQKRVIVRYDGYTFYVSAPKFALNRDILRVAEPLFISFLKRNKDQIHSDTYKIKGLYVLGEFKPLDEGFIEVFGHQVLFINLDDFYDRIKPIVSDYFESLFRECEQNINSNIHHDFKMVKVKTYFGQNMIKRHLIKINLNLIHFKKDVIQSVMYHELAHDIEANHSKNFYKVLEKYDKNYKIHHEIIKKREYERSAL